MTKKNLRNHFSENRLANHKLGFMGTKIFWYSFAQRILKLIPYMVLNTIICLVRKVNLKLFVIYWMTEQNLVKYTTIMERHINYYKNLNLTVWNILRYVLHLFFKQGNKDCIQGDKRNGLLKVVQVNQSKSAKPFSKKQTNKQTKTETSRSSNFFWYK